MPSSVHCVGFCDKSHEFSSSEYKAAEQDDLWHHLTMQAHSDGTLPNDVTVKQIMDTWTLQMGFPVVNVERNYDDNTADVDQVIDPFTRHRIALYECAIYRVTSLVD